MYMTRNTARTAVVLATLLAVRPVGAAEQEDTIVTDRPDFVESSLTVGKGRFQIETSVSREHHADGAFHGDTLAMPTLLRLGVARDWELRVESDFYTRARIEDSAIPERGRTEGLADISLGLKWHVANNAGSIPGVGLLLHADTPSGDRELRGHGVRPSLRAVLEWELPRDFSLGVMPGVAYESRDDGHRYVSGIAAAVLGYAVTDRLRAFAEVAGRELARERNGGNVVTYDFGMAYLLTSRVQLDAAVAIGANDNTPDFGWTIGLSAKF